MFNSYRIDDSQLANEHLNDQTYRNAGIPQREAIHVIEKSYADRLERELSEATEMIDVWKSRSEINGKLAMKMQDERDQALAQAAALAGALEKVQSIVVEDECEECGTFKGVRYEVKPAVEALAAYTAWRKGRE